MSCRYSHWSADCSVGWLRLSAIAPAAAAFIGGCRAPVSLAQGIAVRGRLLALRRRTSKDDAVPRNGGPCREGIMQVGLVFPSHEAPKTTDALLVLCLVFIPPSSRARFVPCWFPRFRGFRPEGCLAAARSHTRLSTPRSLRRTGIRVRPLCALPACRTR
ncbi:hypothetical protein MTO96_006910 [Rhipicephalus appendiculatus]